MRYFTIEELCYSATAKRLGIDNSPNKEVVENLNKLVENVLDPLREKYGKPIMVSSGYRCEKLNKAVGGAAKSQHLTGKAADIMVVNKDGSVNTKETRKLYDIIVKQQLPFDQIILEKGTQQNPQWVHVSYDERQCRRERLFFDGRRYIKI